MTIRAATDVGGTFTDLVFYSVDEQTGTCGAIHSAKVDTTPPNFEEGVMRSLLKGDAAPADLSFFAHGATVVINAITERKGAKVGLITTQGFRDVLEIARGNRPDLFNFNFRKPAPLVERQLRLELRERCNYKGEIEVPVDLRALPDILDTFRSEGVQSIAICFLHAYLNPANEARTAAEVRKLWPGVSTVASHELSREWREYERASTTVLSAYVHPIAKSYIEALETRLLQGGMRGPPYMMLSNGGIATVATAKANPVAMVESGPASGIFAAAHLGKLIGSTNLIVLDIGGTTAKCALIERGEVRITTDYFVERTRRTPGYPIQTPVSEIVEIGNGGGSIAWVDAGGKLHVGPRSAGAMPGPVAYGRGGTEPTTTDANLLLGRIDPKSFAGGEIEPAWQALTRAFETLGRKLGVSAVEAARGVVRIANANMTNALRLVSTNKGYDPRDFALMAFGGGGPMHAVSLAAELKVPRVIVPVNSAVFSAWGMLLTDLRRDYLRTSLLPLTPASATAIQEQFAQMQREALQNFVQDSLVVTGDSVQWEYLVDMRYQGQEHTVKVAVPLAQDEAAIPATSSAGAAARAGVPTVDIAAATDLFHAAHEKRYTYRLANPIQVVNFHLVARVVVPKPAIPKKVTRGLGLAAAVMGSRRVDFDAQGSHDATIYDGIALDPGSSFEGPAVVQEPSVTLVVMPGQRVTVDDYGNYHVEVSPSGKEPI
ncbi:MAG: hydantoinase/oxoprolinase family protein [Gammaproteobacteria bacterium]|nr:hydantoinase/oxoprolinase family protein [Gammaproteobacteria bacterium]